MIKLAVLSFILLVTKPAIPKYDVSVDALTMYNEYKANKVKSDAKYLNKRVFMHGIVQTRSSNLWTVYLRVPDPEGMAARIDDDQLVIAPMYKEGDKFDMICIGEGLVFNSPLLLHCRVP